MPDEALWDRMAGMGMPAALSEAAAPFHPLTLLSHAFPEEGRAAFLTVAGAVLAALLCHLYLLRLGAGRGARAAAAMLVGAVVLAQPRTALFAVGALSLLLAAEWFGASPGRRRWLAVAVVAVLAFLGLRAAELTAFAALAIAAALTASRDRGTRAVVAAGIGSAVGIAAIVTLPWLLLLFAIHPEELPLALRHAYHWPLALSAAVALLVAVGRDALSSAAWRLTTAAGGGLLLAGFAAGSGGTVGLAAIALAALIARCAARQAALLAAGAVAVMLLASVATRPAECAIRSERRGGALIRILDTSAPSLDCVSSRAASLLARARIAETWDLDSPALDVAGIEEVDGAPNRDALPDFHLAPRLRIASRGPVEAERLDRDVALVDHVPPKIAARAAGLFDGAAGREIAGSGGTLQVEHRAVGRARIRVRSGGWNLLVTTEPAWSGWRSYWNGERLPPVVVNQAFVGSFVPPGEGVMLIRYRPDEIDTGLRVAVIGLLLLGFTLWKPWWRAVPMIRLPPLPARVPAIPRAAFRPTVRQASIAGTLLLAGYCALLAVKFAAVAGGADSSGYANHARLWEQGRFILPIEFPRHTGLPPEHNHIFVPLGFVFGTEPYTMVPSYPPGLPLMIVAARAVAGEWAAFRVVALLAATGVLLMYLLGRQFGLPRGWAAAGAAILALFPTYVFMSIGLMTDSVAAALAVAAMLCALRGGEHARWAAAAGALFGMGVLVRPTQFLLLPAILLALRLRPRALLALGLGGLPFAVLQAAVSQHLYGNPLSTGYGGIGYLMSVDGAMTRLEHYSYWLAVLGTPVVFPGGMAIWFSRSTDCWTRATLAAWLVPLFAFYTFYAPHEAWWYTRFLLPALPALIIGALLAVRTLSLRVSGRWRAGGPMLIGLVIFAAIFHTIRFDVLSFARWEAVYTESIRGAERHLPDDAMLLAMQMSGALRYYSGKPIVRWDQLDAESYTRVVGAAGSRPWYALLADFEIAEAMRRAPGEWVEVERYRSVVLYRLVPKTTISSPPTAALTVPSHLGAE